jgi:hypothetical protein
MLFGPGGDGPQFTQGEGPGPRHQFQGGRSGLGEGGLGEGGLAKGCLHQRQSAAQS